MTVSVADETGDSELPLEFRMAGHAAKRRGWGSSWGCSAARLASVDFPGELI